MVYSFDRHTSTEYSLPRPIPATYMQNIPHLDQLDWDACLRSCGWGTTTTGGAKGVGESTTAAVVIGLVGVFVAVRVDKNVYNLCGQECH
eukprot:7278823-Pyramimonas_sp.AAC.2